MLDQRDEPPNAFDHPVPPWVSSALSASASASASAASATALASASASSEDDRGASESETSSETSSVPATYEVATSPTTLITSVSLGSSSIDLLVSSASMLPQAAAITGSSTPDSYVPTSTGSFAPDFASYTSAGYPKSEPGPTQAYESLTSNSKASSATSYQSTAQASAIPNGSSITSNRHAFDGAILAAIIVPIVAVLAVGLALLLCIRRRRRARAATLKPITEGRAEVFTKRSPSAATSVEVRQVTPPQPHLITSPQNTTYYTGLETMSMMSAEPAAPTNDDPPPPYRTRSDATPRPASVRSADTAVSHFQPALHAFERPLSPLDSSIVAERSPFDDPPSPMRSNSMSRSITSTLYSSNASLVEARPMRTSVGGPFMVDMDVRSPFADPESGPNQHR